MADPPDTISRPTHIIPVTVLFCLIGLNQAYVLFYHFVNSEFDGRYLFNLIFGILIIPGTYGLIRRKKWSLYFLWPVLIFLFLTLLVFLIGGSLSAVGMVKLLIVIYCGWALNKSYEQGFFGQTTEATDNESPE